MVNLKSSHKIVAVLLSVALAFSVIGCSKKKESRTLEEFFQDLGYANKADAVNYGEESDGIYGVIVDKNELENLAGYPNIESLFLASKMTNYEGDFKNDTSYGTRGIEAGYYFQELKFEDKDAAEETFDQLISFFETVKDFSGDDSDYLYSDIDDDSLSLIVKIGDCFNYTEYYINKDTIVAINGQFVCKDAAYDDFIKLYDYLDRDFIGGFVDDEPMDEGDFDIDAYVANDDNMFTSAKTAVKVKGD